VSAVAGGMFTRCGKKRRGLGGGAGYHPLPCFSQEYDSMGVRWWGCAKDMILKGIVACGEWPAEARGAVLLSVDFNAEGTEFTEVRGRGRKSR
jgi:hypothetical protein